MASCVASVGCSCAPVRSQRLPPPAADCPRPTAKLGLSVTPARRRRTHYEPRSAPFGSRSRRSDACAARVETCGMVGRRGRRPGGLLADRRIARLQELSRVHRGAPGDCWGCLLDPAKCPRVAAPAVDAGPVDLGAAVGRLASRSHQIDPQRQCRIRRLAVAVAARPRRVAQESRRFWHGHRLA